MSVSEVLEGSPLCVYVWFAAHSWDALLTSTAGTEQQDRRHTKAQNSCLELSRSTRDNRNTLSMTRYTVARGRGERRQLVLNVHWHL